LTWVYAIAFLGDRFAMVHNPKRNGWEMPGGKIEKGESPEEAADREMREECGCSFIPYAKIPLRQGWVLTGDLGCPCGKGEMRLDLFAEFPDRLAFELDEYLEVLRWAREERNKRCSKDDHFRSNLI